MLIRKIIFISVICLFSITLLASKERTSNNHREKFNEIISIPEGFVLVDGGTFEMGSKDGEADEEPVRRVKISDFIIKKTEVTQSEYLEYCNSEKENYPEWLKEENSRNIHNGSDYYYKKHAGEGKENYPIVGISWSSAIAYCNWLSKKEGFAVAYNETNGELLNKHGNVTVDVTEVEGYRLPTEA